MWMYYLDNWDGSRIWEIFQHEYFYTVYSSILLIGIRDVSNSLGIRNNVFQYKLFKCFNSVMSVIKWDYSLVFLLHFASILMYHLHTPVMSVSRNTWGVAKIVWWAYFSVVRSHHVAYRKEVPSMTKEGGGWRSPFAFLFEYLQALQLLTWS